MHLTFRSLYEDAPGDAWRKVYAHGWPGWSEWFRHRSAGKPALEEARRALRRHMPDYENLWDELNTVCGADDEAARFLSFWSPPRYLVNCSQAVVVDEDGPYLIRNYDLDPDLNEATLLSTCWRGQRVVGMVEALAGLADGMNEAGLAASLTFGGRVERRSGFGIPLIMRYLLQSCRDVQDAVQVLRSVPSHMSYNVTVLDRAGSWATVFLAPDRPPIVTEQAWATNHQLGVEWPRHGRISRTLERAKALESLLGDPGMTGSKLSEAFRNAPIFSTNYAGGFGTVYTAAYRPVQGEVTLTWKDGSAQRWNIRDVEERQQTIRYSASGSEAVPTLAPLLSEEAATRPDWYSDFLKATTHPYPDQDGTLRARLAAFWRRNHFGEDRNWSNLTPLRFSHTEQE